MRDKVRRIPVNLLIATAFILIAWLAFRQPQWGPASDLDAAMVEPATPSKVDPAVLSDHTTRGQIVSVKGRVISLTSDGQTEDFLVPRNATIVKNTRPTEFAAVQAGDIVNVTHSDATNNDEEVVISLHAWSTQ